MALLSWDLVSPVEYAPNQVLKFNLHFEAPDDTEAKKFYVLGGLYTDSSYVPGSLFGVLKAAQVDYGINDPTYVSLWELEPGAAVDLPCRFTLNRTSCLLALFLMKMVGYEPSLDGDEQLAQIQTQLTAPQSVWEKYIVPIALVAIMAGMVATMSRTIFKE